jgi:hypothetical protein
MIWVRKGLQGLIVFKGVEIIGHADLVKKAKKKRRKTLKQLPKKTSIAVLPNNSSTVNIQPHSKPTN